MITMYLPNTPSQFVGGAKIIKVKKVLMTCGGGMGGSSWTEYIVDFPRDINEKNIVKVTNWKGEKMHLNTRYIVKVTDGQIVGITIDSQNKNCGVGVSTHYYATPIDNDVRLQNTYGDNEQTKGVQRIAIVR